MTSQELIDTLQKLGLTQDRLAKSLRMSPRTVSRWVDGSAPLQHTETLLLEAWLKLDALGQDWHPIVEGDEKCPCCKLYFPFHSNKDKAKYSEHLLIHIGNGELNGKSNQRK